MSPTLSVVVPFYNVESYLQECLDSLSRQSLSDLEVILVDDGSTDGGAVIAKAQVHRDPRFVLVTQDNAGLGPARNTGVRHATGTYLAFADSDDMVADYAYERMVASLEETGSDLVSGAVHRFTAARSNRARFYGDAFRSTRLRTHISRDPELLHDRTAWNKVFRRSFWDSHDFAFPTGAYEDAPVTLAAHVRAESVDVLREVVYLYRHREGGEQSITQRRTELSNLEDRLSSIGSVSAFLRAHAPALRDRYDLTTLDKDLMIFIDVVDQGDEAYQSRLFALVGAYLDQVDPALVGKLSAIKRLKYHLIRAGNLADLLQVQEFERTGLPVAPVEARGILRRRWLAGHPFRGDATRAIPDAVYDVTGELSLHTQIDAITWERDTLRLTGHAYVEGIDMSIDDRVEVWLQHTKTPRRLRLDVRRVLRPEVTANSHQPAACYDGSGFAVEVDVARLTGVPGWRNADWRVHVGVRIGRGLRPLRLQQAVTRCGAAAQWPRYQDLPSGVRVQAVPMEGGDVLIRVRSIKAQATGCRADGDSLEITGWVSGPVPTDDTAVLSCRERGVTMTVALAYGSSEGNRTPFSLRLPLTTTLSSDLGSATHWDLAVRPHGKDIRLAAPQDFLESAVALQDRAVVVSRTRYGNLTLIAGPAPHLVTRAAWEGTRLVVEGRTADGHRAGQVILRRRRTGVQHAFPIRWGEEGAFTASFDLAAVTTLAGVLPLPPGAWDLLVPTADGTTRPLSGGRACLGELPEGHEVAGHYYRLWPARGDGLCLHGRTALPDDQRGPYAQRLLQERDYPAFLRLPQRDLIMFESYFGWQYSCNPKAVHEELRRRETGHELVWVKGDQHFHLPGGGRTVQRHSREYYELTAAARIVVNNVAQPTSYRERPGQTYVQTWHGTPIKTVGFDMNWARMERREQRMRELRADVSRWDLLVSPNSFTTEVMRRAFEYEGEILQSGYPRNDLAYHPSADQIRRRLRTRLGVPDGKRAILYTPTWRDHLQTQSHGLAQHDLGLDLDRAAAVLGSDAVVLLRRHHLLNAPIPPGYEHLVIDVTHYPDVTELFLAADALVTDYSSAMCDFAGLGKPIVLFAPDLDNYAQVRGFTFDLTTLPPGPITSTSEELLYHLHDLDAVASGWSAQRSAFADRFCPHDDGNAAARVVDRLLELHP